MTAIDVASLRRHIGTKISDEDMATEAPLKAIVATFDRQEEAPGEGQPVPPGWQIGYFLSTAPTATLGRRRYAHGRGRAAAGAAAAAHVCRLALHLHAPLRSATACAARRSSRTCNCARAARARLILTTQARRISTSRGLAITEEYDTVFREEVKPGAKSGIPKRDEPPAGLPWRRTITPGPVTLFRFSALTGNPHRIHYDRPYTMEVEGYPGLVVHGPFTQACAHQLRARQQPRTRDPHLRHARPRAIVRYVALRAGRPADRGRRGLRGVGRNARRHHRHAGRDAGPTLPPRPPQGREHAEAAMIEPLSTPTLPRGIRSRFVDNINGLRMHVLEAGFEAEGAAVPAAPARLPRARLQLAQGDAAAGGGRLPRGRPRSARLRPHHRLDRRLRWRSRLLPHAQPGARHRSASSRRSAIAPSRRGRPRLRLAGCGWCALVRPDVFRSVTLMSAPFAGPPSIPFATADAPPPSASTEARPDHPRRPRRAHSPRASITTGTIRRGRPMPT